MIALAIETSAKTATLALEKDGRVELAELGPDPRHGRSVAAGIAALLERSGVQPPSIDRIAVAVGPGGYSGLRIGVATAKSLAFVLGKPLVGVDSLAALAARPEAPAGALVAAIDAGRGAVYAARFDKRPDGTLVERAAPEFFDAEAVLALARSIDRAEFVAGDGLPVLSAAGAGAFGRADLAPTAAQVLALARIRDPDGTPAPGDDVLPRYLRPSEAERLWRRRQLERSKPSDEMGR